MNFCTNTCRAISRCYLSYSYNSNQFAQLGKCATSILRNFIGCYLYWEIQEVSTFFQSYAAAWAVTENCTANEFCTYSALCNLPLFVLHYFRLLILHWYHLFQLCRCEANSTFMFTCGSHRLPCVVYIIEFLFVIYQRANGLFTKNIYLHRNYCNSKKSRPPKWW